MPTIDRELELSEQLSAVGSYNTPNNPLSHSLPPTHFVLFKFIDLVAKQHLTNKHAYNSKAGLRTSILGIHGWIQLSFKLPLINFGLIQVSAIPGMKPLSLFGGNKGQSRTKELSHKCSTWTFVRLCWCNCYQLPRTSILETWRPGTLASLCEQKIFHVWQCMI